MSDDITDAIRRLNQTPEVMAAELRRAMTASLLLVEADARVGAPHDTRRLAGSISHRIDGGGLQPIGHVGPSVGYGATVEFGRRAGARMPPVQALFGWVQRHFHAPRERVTEATLFAEAFALARAISRRGIPARPFLVPAYEKNRPQIDALFAAVSARVVASIAGRGPV
jgi:hypothetical protein